VKSHNPSGTEQEIRNRPLQSGLADGSLRCIVPERQLPAGVRVQVLLSRKPSRKVIIGSRPITGTLGEVIDPAFDVLPFESVALSFATKPVLAERVPKLSAPNEPLGAHERDQPADCVTPRRHRQPGQRWSMSSYG
jgi:hypothetical protein